MTPEVQTILHLLSGSALCCKGKDGHGHGDHVVSVTHPDGTVTSAIVMFSPKSFVMAHYETSHLKVVKFLLKKTQPANFF